MDKEQYLELYKNKFEYLEFNDYILKAFDKAYEVAKNNKAENFNMTLEYRFILELIFIIKNGYKDAYDALSIYCEKYNEFYLRKKKNLVKDISQMTQKEYYDKAFEITINNYMEGQIFYKELIQNLILVYKNQIPSKGVLDMKYDSSIKSIYDLFAKYNREVVEMVLEVSKTVEPNSTSILMKKYGQKFDGVNPQRITYIENSRIDNILTRIEQKIELTEYEINNGKTLKSMSKFLKKCGDVLLLEAISNMKKNKSETTILTNISDIKKKYDINDTILKMAIDFNKETIEKKVFYYTFGFTTAKKSIREICNLLEINSYSYNNYLNSILSKLPELIRQAQEYYELMQENPVKKKEQKENQQNNEDFDNTKIPAHKKLKKTFFEYFYDEKNTQEEIEQIKKNIKFLLSKKTNIQGYDLLIRRYGQDYCTLDENVVFNKQENSLFNSFRQNLKKELYKKNGDKTTIDSKTHTITSFFDYFYTDTMSLEEKEQIKKFIIEYLETRKKSIAYAVLIKKFGENYDTLNDNISLNRQENNNLGALRQSIKKALVAKKYQTDNSRKKISVKKNETKTFYEYFYDKDMDEEQKANVRVLVNEAIEKRKNDLGYQYLIKKFGEDYCTLIPNALTVSEKNSFYYFKNSIKDDIQKGAKDVKKRGRKIKTSFFEFFYTAAMTEEEKKEINKKIINILNEYKHLKGYECIIRRYSGTLDKIDYSVSYDKTQKSEVEFLKRTIKFRLNNENTKEKRNNKLSFYDYFYEEGMDLDRKAKLEIRVKSILEENKHLAGYYVITKLFSENLNTKNKEEVLTNSDKAAMFYMIKKIKEQLAKSNEANKETIKNESIIGRNQEKKIESKEIPNKLNYADTIIYKLTEMGYSIDKIAVILNTDINFILESYINNIDYYHINFVIDMILKYNPKYLINLLNSGYFKELLNEITPIEKQLIYYLILAKNDKMDIEDISKIMSISIEDIMNYQIYFKEDRYNELNNYIHLSNDKKRKISF